MRLFFAALVFFSAGAHANMAGKSLKLKGGVAIGDCAAGSTEKQFNCKTPHSAQPLTITFDDQKQPYANWSQTYRIGDNFVRADFEIYDNGNNFDVSATLTVYGQEDRVTSVTFTLKNLESLERVNTSTPPLPSPQGMKVVDLTITL